jgi:hypothetical protein
MDITFIEQQLLKDYGYTLTREEVAEVLNISVSTVDRKRKQYPKLFPPFKKVGFGDRAPVKFSAHGVAQYLAQIQ